jgi:hypothetical protein
LKTIKEGTWYYDADGLYYPRVSSCLCVSIINGGIIYGMHGVIGEREKKPKDGGLKYYQNTITELIFALKRYKQIGKDSRLIITCDFNGTWGDNGELLRVVGGIPKIGSFKSLAEYFNIPWGQVRRENVGDGTRYYITASRSAYFVVSINGSIFAYAEGDLYGTELEDD